ncbi:MAG: hypothetical protein AMXMBFR4_07780 [Candidatus Hydrogenedentota bacterium]
MSRKSFLPALGLAAVLSVAIALPSQTARAASIAEGGCLVVYDKEQNPRGQCPLEHTDVEVEISGFVARVTLKQRFGNPYSEPIEAIYAFPMSERAAVDTMSMRIGDRTIRGLIKEREEAQRIYQRARDAGQAASLLDQERPNIFTQSVANILPGDNIEITISYVEYLKYEDGEYEFSFPMVVGPRYIPGNAIGPTQEPTPPGLKPGPESTDQVPDSGRITPPVTPEGTRAGHDIALAVRIDAGVPIRDIASELHEINVELAESSAKVTLKDKNEIPNRDFVLRYKVAGESIGDAVLTHAGDRGGFFTLILQPPDRVEPESVTPKEMIFVIDKSGSMSGFPIEKAKQTMRMCIQGMNPNDTFNLVSFAGGLGYCFDRPMPNTRANRRAALEYLKNLEGGGGTEMMNAIHAALSGQYDRERLRVVCLMTDGYIGNDMAIIDAIQKHAGTARVFSFGIGDSVNRFLIEGMARAGRGEAEIVTLASDGDSAAKRFHERIQNPLLTDISLEVSGLEIDEVFPSTDAIPDLFSARPLILTGRYGKPGVGTITLRGRTARGPYERTIPVTLPASEPDHDVLAPLWARQRIEWLMEQDWLGIQLGKANRDVKADITKLGLEFGLVTQFTSFVAVEDRVITEGGRPKTVEVPVEMPNGVSYDGIFGEATEADVAQVVALRSLGYVGGAQAPASALPLPARPQSVETLGRARKSATMAESMAENRPTDSMDLKNQEGASTRVRADESKLHSSLVGLAAKVVRGNYTEGKVKVANGWVEVFVYLKRVDQRALDELTGIGVKLIAELRTKKLIHCRVKIEDLAEVTNLANVVRIEPPAF